MKESQIVYYFISRTEEKKHIWFLILCECVSHLMLVYGFLFLWIEKVFMASTVVDMLKLLMLIDTFSKWLSYQLFCQAYVNITLYLPDIPIPQTEDVDKLCLSPYRNKKLCMC